MTKFDKDSGWLMVRMFNDRYTNEVHQIIDFFPNRKQMRDAKKYYGNLTTTSGLKIYRIVLDEPKRGKK